MTELAPEEHQYHSALISTAGHCAVACGFCFRADRGHGFLQMATYAQSLSRLREFGVTGVCLTGGEPTHHPQFRQLVRVARQFGLPISVVTSAREDVEIHRLSAVAHLLENVTVSADSVGAMLLGRTKRSVASSMKTVTAVGPTNAVLHLTYWQVTDDECKGIARAIDGTAATLQISPVGLDAAALSRQGLTQAAYAAQQAADTAVLDRHFVLSDGFRQHLERVGNLEPARISPTCRSSTLYVSADGKLRRCPFGREEADLTTAPRTEIARFLAGAARDRVTPDCAALCHASDFESAEEEVAWTTS